MLSRLIRPLRLIVIPVVVSLGACDNPVQDDTDHVEEIASVEITDVQGGLIAEFDVDHWNFEGGGDALHLHPGDEMEVRIFFVAADGDRFQLPLAGEEHTLRVDIADPTVAEYEGVDDRGHFVAVAAGETTAAIQVYHGGHPDWQTSPPLPIEVVDHPAH